MPRPGHPRSRILHSRMMFRGPVFGVRRDRVVEPGGAEVTRDVVTHTGSVVILPVFPGGRILMVRQYRHAAGRALWELVAGRVDPGEKPRVAARRELREETGYAARTLRLLLDIYPTPGFVAERMRIYLASGLRAGPAQPESDERIVARQFTTAELKRMMRRGALRDAKTIAGILYYLTFVAR